MMRERRNDVDHPVLRLSEVYALAFLRCIIEKESDVKEK